MEILGAVGIWLAIHIGGFCFYVTNTYNVGALFFVTYSLYLHPNFLLEFMIFHIMYLLYGV